MQALIYQVLVILHIIAAAAWFGLGLRLAAQARRVLSAPPEAGKALHENGAGSIKIMNIMIILTIVFAYAAFFMGGGFTGYPPSYHISLTLILVLAALHFFVIRSGWTQLSRAWNGSADDASSARKKVAIGTGVGHLLWLTILVLMFWPRISAVT